MCLSENGQFITILNLEKVETKKKGEILRKRNRFQWSFT